MGNTNLHLFSSLVLVAESIQLPALRLFTTQPGVRGAAGAAVNAIS